MKIVIKTGYEEARATLMSLLVVAIAVVGFALTSPIPMTVLNLHK